MVDLKCKNCGYEHSVGQQFYKGKEHKCPGCATTGQVVIKIREGEAPIAPTETLAEEPDSEQSPIEEEAAPPRPKRSKHS